MKNLAKILLVVGTVSLVVAVSAKLMNAPLFGSTPAAMFNFADSCFLLAIGLLLAEGKK